MAAGDLTDLTSVKTWLEITTTNNDTLLGQLITAASAWIVDYLSRPILSASYTETRKGTGNDSMTMRAYPITAVASIAWNGTSITAAADPIAGSPGFLFDGRRIDLIGNVFPYGCPVVISYTAGYVTAPADVQQACTELVGEAYKRRERIGQTSKTLGGQETVAFSQKDMNEAVRTALASYRNTVPV